MEQDQKVLLIEDNPGDIRLIKEFIKDDHNASFNLDCANCLAVGLSLLTDNRYDIILLDLSLPDSQGLESLLQLRSKYPNIPVVILSGLDDEATAVEAVHIGAQDYIVKGQGDSHTVSRSLRYAIERMHVQEALTASETRFRLLAENITDVIWLLDSDLKLLEISPSIISLTGYTQAEVIQLGIDKIITPDSFQTTRKAIEEEIDYQKQNNIVRDPFWSRPLELEYIRKDRKTVYAEVKLSMLHELDGRLRGFLGITRDISDRKKAEEALARHAQELAALHETTLEINAQSDLDTLLNAIIERAARLSGAEMGGLYLLQPDGLTLELVVNYRIPNIQKGLTLKMGEGLSGRVAQTGEPLIIVDYKNWEGRASVYENLPFQRTLGVPMKIGQRILGVITVINDQFYGELGNGEVQLVSMFADQAALAVDKVRLYNEIQKLAVIDELTGLYNRRGFFTLADQQMKLARRSNNCMLLIFADIDQLKHINDTCGHQQGDQVIMEAAQILSHTFRSSDIIARMGGDEFAVLAIQSSEHDSVLLSTRLSEQIQHVNSQPNRVFNFSMSVGITSWDPAQPKSIDEVLSNADALMYEHKRNRVITR